MNGLLLAIQFFTVIPVNKELPLGRKNVTMMYGSLPFIGAFIGLGMYSVLALTFNVAGFGFFLAAVLITLTGVLLTGGLHLDGLADTSDAFFSYRDRQKRLEILEDPRIGAFGTMAVVLFLLLKVALFQELIQRGGDLIVLFVTIPILARASMNIVMATTRSAKDKGLVHYFKEQTNTYILLAFSFAVGFITLFVIGFFIGNFLALIILLVISAGVLLFRSWSFRHFGGITGDLCGALIEGMEAVLWLVALFCM
ncbi:adenosylcobinamide-GDP ribazoletransferase [Sporosarcina sp. HYO08]|uniref:adenosylcobinamide-GDP ribazoletransferase n=1 Tax=Sporosarcina sp. HYO08 TaxID=1759557 RepID=UPI000793916F|nr:adenosylcobinamide-GDP ribazoletransferase [Sporosarcina sp. HYO08]KXH83946.1 hypothetical protein AU377_04115 [Sporosarcina sp. HYO08]